MKHTLTRNITCTDSFKCADIIRKRLETPALKLMARSSIDTVNGHITIHHVQKAHIINITIYEKDEAPNQNHKTIFLKPTEKIQLEKL